MHLEKRQEVNMSAIGYAVTAFLLMGLCNVLHKEGHETLEFVLLFPVFKLIEGLFASIGFEPGH